MEKDAFGYGEIRQYLETVTRSLKLVRFEELEKFRLWTQSNQESIRAALTFANSGLDREWRRSFEAIGRLDAQLLEDLQRSAQDAVNSIHQTWLSDIAATQQSITDQVSVARLVLEDVSVKATLAASRWDKIDLDAIGKQWLLQQDFVNDLRASLDKMKHSFVSLTQSFGDAHNLLAMPSFILPGALQELYSTSDTINVLQPRDKQWEIQYDGDVELPAVTGTTSGRELEELLSQVDPALVGMYHGALRALEHDNPDRARHVLVSLRTLVDHVLWALAPNNESLAWISLQGENSFLHEGKPTRSGRVMFILREQAGGPVAEFVGCDMQVVNLLYSVFNRVHGKNPGVPYGQLRMIVFRTEAFLQYLLRVRQ